jgi:hypothetical protein
MTAAYGNQGAANEIALAVRGVLLCACRDRAIDPCAGLVGALPRRMGRLHCQWRRGIRDGVISHLDWPRRGGARAEPSDPCAFQDDDP